MSLSQQKPVSPPITTDRQLVDYSSVIQDNLRTLFQAGHVHLGQNGVLTAAPTAQDGNQGDIILAVISGVAYIYIKTDRTHWWKSTAFTAV
jgi:hypothetical protein